MRLAEMINWKGSRVRLFNRISAVCKLSNFSVREMKLLKRIVKKEFSGIPIDYERVLYEFPGKTMRQIKQECNKICTSISKRIKV